LKLSCYSCFWHDGQECRMEYKYISIPYTPLFYAKGLYDCVFFSFIEFDIDGDIDV